MFKQEGNLANNRAPAVKKCFFSPQEVLWGEDWHLLCLVGFLHNNARSGSCCGTGLFHLWIQDSRNQHVEVHSLRCPLEISNDELGDQSILLKYNIYHMSSCCHFCSLLFFFAPLCRFHCLIFSLLSLKCCSKEVCDPEIGGKIVMCPQCDRECNYWRLNSTCEASKVSSNLFQQ